MDNKQIKIHLSLLVLFFSWRLSASTARGTADPSVELLGAAGAAWGQVVARPKDTVYQWSTSVGVVGSSNPMVRGDVELYSGLWVGNGLRAPKVENTLLLSTSSLVRVVIPMDALPANFLPTVSENPMDHPLRVSTGVIRSANDHLKAMGSYSFPLGGRVWEIFVQDEFGQRQSGLLAKPAKITLPYNDSNHDGIVDGTEGSYPVRAATLSIWWLDEEKSNWVKLPNSTVNTENGTVSTQIHHFSVFAVMGDISFSVTDIYAYPVPFRPTGPTSGAGAGQTGTTALGITFKNLPSECAIRIYTLGGELVKEMSHTSGTAVEVWNVKNDDGEDVATGTYIWSVDSGGSRKTGKLAVIR